MNAIISLFLSIIMFFSGIFGSVTDLKISGRENINNVPNNYASLCADYLEYISNHFLKNDDNAKSCDKKGIRNYIVSTLKEAGYKDSDIELESVHLRGTVFPEIGKNIVLTVPGKDTSKQIVVGAHYDGSGTGDNASGVALVLATAVGLHNTKLPYTVKYVWFDNEESGLHGSYTFSSEMSSEEVKSTLYMINIDCVAFGDYCNIYGGITNGSKVTETQSYEFAMKRARELGFNTYGTDYLDGYYAKNGKGPALDPNGFFTNPWTKANPAPNGDDVYSPSTHGASDFVGFSNRGIQYIYFEATNMYSDGNNPTSRNAYSGYYETADKTIGNNGMFMNTRFDTLKNLEKYFPGRAIEHYNLYSPLLSSLLVNPSI